MTTSAAPPDRTVIASDDRLRLTAWISNRLGVDPGTLQIEPLGTTTGVANIVLRLTSGDQSWVLRRPPAVKITKSAGLMDRENRILSALASTDVPHPRAVAFCDDVEVFGAPFLLQEFVDGFTPVRRLPPPFDRDPVERHGIGIGLVDGIARLAMVDWKAVGLEGFGRPDGFLERQVARWRTQLETYRQREIPLLDEVCAALESKRPVTQRVGILHGDYSLFNVLVSHQTPAHLAAIVDWDTATIGDPLLDLGYVLARWADPGERPVIDDELVDRTGWPTRTELAGHYVSRTGADLSDIDYYQALSMFKLACILEGHYAQTVQGLREVGPASSHEATVPRLIEHAHDLIHRA